MSLPENARTADDVLFDRICHNNDIKHRLTAPYSPTTTGKVERLHRTMRREFFELATYDTLEETQIALDAWVLNYNTERPHQSLGDIPPLRRFELADAATSWKSSTARYAEPDATLRKSLSRIVDDKGRVLILRYRYHVGRAYQGETVSVSLEDGLLSVHHRGVLIATHARAPPARRRRQVHRPTEGAARRHPTGDEVYRSVDNAGCGQLRRHQPTAPATPTRVSSRACASSGDTVQITVDGRSHSNTQSPSRSFKGVWCPRHAQRQTQESRCRITTEAKVGHGW